jgi:hypothetical protein
MIDSDDADRMRAALLAAARAGCICDGECYETRHGDMHGPCEARENEAARIIDAFLRALPAAAREEAAYRAGAEAMREACAAEVDCRCAARDAVLAAMERGGTPRPDWLCPIGSHCYATMAQNLRELPLPTMKRGQSSPG